MTYFWDGFEKKAIDKKVFMLARENRFRKAFTSAMEKLKNKVERYPGRKVRNQPEYTWVEGVIPDSHKHYRAKAEAIRAIQTKRARRTINRPGQDPRRAEHIAWKNESTKELRRLRLEDLLSGQRVLPLKKGGQNV